MKKYVLVLTLIVGILGSVNAQKVKFGVKGGMNLSTLGSDMKDNLKDYEGLSQKTRIGFHIGAFADVELMENFYIQPGLFYSSKGLKAKDGGDEMKVNLNYLEIPILASYRIAISDKIKWHINAGPYLAYGLGGKIKTKYDDGWDDDDWDDYYSVRGGDWDDEDDYWGDYEDDDDDIKAFDEKGGDLKRFDFGLSLGTGIEFNAFYVGLKYDLGLVNIAGKSWDKTKIKNSNFAVSVGYTF